MSDADQRYYASSYGRFNAPDPMANSASPKDPGTRNLYAYVAGDPVNRGDPHGTCYTFNIDGTTSWMENPDAEYALYTGAVQDWQIVHWDSAPCDSEGVEPDGADTLAQAGDDGASDFTNTPADCANALTRLASATANVLQRIAEIVADVWGLVKNGRTDPGHRKALRQACNRLRNALQQVTTSCASSAAVAAAVAAAEAALAQAAPYLLAAA